MKYCFFVLFIFFTGASFAQTKEHYDHLYDSLQKTNPPEQVIAYFLKELKLHPKEEWVLRTLGFAYLANNEPDKGEKYYRDALAINPKCAYCYMNIGRVYANKKDYPKAMELINQSISLAPGDGYLYNTRAQLKEIMGDKFGAMADCDKAIAKDPKNADYYIQRSGINATQGYQLAALSDMNKAVELAPKSYYVYYKRSMLYFDKQQWKEAMTDINMAIQLDSTHSELYIGRAAVYASNKEYQNAISDYDKAIALNPNDFGAYYNRSLQKYGQEDMDGSCADIHACYALLQKNDSSNPLKQELDYSITTYCDSGRAGYYYQRGIALYNLEQYQKAVDIYTIGHRKFPDNGMTLSFRGNAYFMLKDYAHALPDYYASIAHKDNLADDILVNQKHTGVDIGSIDSYVNGFLAGMYVNISEAKFAGGEFDSALTAVNLGIELAPDIKELGRENFYNVRGNILMALQRFPEALKDFDQCISMNPSLAIAYVYRAVAKINTGQRVRMTSYFIGAGVNNEHFNTNWSLPLKTTIKKTDTNVLSALADCNTAIAMEPGLDAAYYIRGQVKKILQYNGYCVDILKAKELGYNVEVELLRACGK